LTRLLVDLAQVPRHQLPDRFLAGLRPGAEIGRFVVQRELGRGGFGIVYQALDRELGRPVALKVLHPGAGTAALEPARLGKEAEAVARLQHPGIVTLFDVGQTDDAAYLVFELLAGETLASRLRRGPLESGEAARVGLAVARALAHAHGAGVLHRDLKPANVFLCADGGVKVLDFGLAHLLGGEVGHSGGTPGFHAPEQLGDQASDERTDLFGLGVLLHVMTGGPLPAPSRGAAPAAAALRGGGGSRPLRALVRELTRPDPEARPRTIHPVVRRLEALSRARPGPLRRWGPALAAVALAAGVLLFGATWRGRGVAPPGKPVQLVLVDAENATGLADLDWLAPLVRIALSDSQVISLVPAGRLGLAARAAGRPLGDRLDGGGARALAPLVGAGGLLRISARREGPGFVLALRSETAEGAATFEAEAPAATEQAIPPALDSLLGALRTSLGDPPDRRAAGGGAIAALTTPTLAAFAAYARGLECVQQASRAAHRDDLDRCGAFFRAALAGDPSFGLAHYQLAHLLSSRPQALGEARQHLEAALAAGARLSRRDAGLVWAWSDHLAGRDDEALRRYADLLARAPDDAPVLRLAGDLAFARGDYAAAAPYLARAFALEPQAEWALDGLVKSYALTGATTELRALAGQLLADPGWPHRSAAIRALVWLGDHARAVELASAAAAERPDGDRRNLLLGVLLAADRLEEAAALGEVIAAQDPGDSMAHLLRIIVARSRGQVRQAWRLAERPAAASRDRSPVEQAYVRAMLAAGDGDRARLLAETRKVYAASPALSAAAVVLLALVDPGDQAGAFLAGLGEAPTAAAEVEALLAWRAGRGPEAIAALAALERRDPWPENAIAPSYLLAEVALATDPAEALAAAERFGRLWPRGLWRGWAYPRSLLVAAQAARRLGDHARAESHLRRLEALLARADADLALGAEAAALRRLLAATPSGR
jgi:hypothetical protein